jgi:integrase
MSGPNSTSPTPSVKPERPQGSPLFWHATGRWAKKIRGRLHYFGRGAHADALAEYTRCGPDLHAGRLPRDEQSGELTVYQLCAKFMTAKRDQRDDGELSPRMFVEYGEACKRLIRQFGKGRAVGDLGPDDFAGLCKRMAKTWAPVRLKAEIIRSRTPFLWASKSGLIDRPPVYGQSFKPPSDAVIRKHRVKRGPKLFEAVELRKLLAAAGPPLRAMVLLGANGGFGNGDIAGLPIAALDLAGGWLDFARPKTGIGRRIPVWPETVAAVRDWLAVRPAPRDPAHADLLFVTYKCGSWKDDTGRALSHEFRKLADSVAVNGHRGFYCVRHTFQTIGDECGDFIAVRKIMGHVSNDIGDVYRERVGDERIRKVTEHVRGWLFADRTK